MAIRCTADVTCQYFPGFGETGQPQSRIFYYILKILK